jgi:hypothetical protein
MRKTYKGGKRMRGRGLMDWLRKAGDWVKSNKLVSRGLHGISGALPGAYGTIARTAGDAAAHLGWGRRRRVKGGSLTLAGGSLGGMRRLRLR